MPTTEGAAIVTAKAGACEAGYTKTTLLGEAEQEAIEHLLLSPQDLRRIVKLAEAKKTRPQAKRPPSAAVAAGKPPVPSPR